MLSSIPLRDITEEHLLRLRENEVPESLVLDYKRDAIGTERDVKKEFLRDVVAFANTMGGDLVIGISAADGVPNEVAGIQLPNADEEMLRLTNMTIDSINPSIQGIEIQPIPLKSGAFVLVVRVPRSWNPPHQVMLRDDRYYGRDSTRNSQLTPEALRRVIMMREENAELIRQFCHDRFDAILQNHTPIPLPDNRRLVLHLVPLNAFAAGSKVDVNSPFIDIAEFIQVQGSGGRLRHNIDGLLAYDEDVAYAQLYRNGIFEIVRTLDVEARGPEGPERYLPGLVLDRNITVIVWRAIEVYCRLEVAPPIFVMLSLSGVDEVILVERTGMRVVGPGFDRLNISVPEVLIQSFADDVEPQCRDLLDALWNASGWPRSRSYDENGNWTNR